MKPKPWAVIPLLLLLTVACGPSEIAVGKWVEAKPGAGSERKLEILPDGRMIETVTYTNRNPDVFTWIYQRFDNDEFQLRDTKGTRKRVTISIFGQNMTLRDHSSQAEYLFTKE